MTAFQAPEGYVPLDETNNVYKKLITVGSGATASRKGSTVKVHYTGSLYATGEVFDSSIERGDPIEFKIGTGQVVKGWDVGISTMLVGEHAELLIQPEYGYGKTGSPPKIPGDSVLLFKVELVSVDESTAEMTIAEKISKAQELKNKGNEQFKESKLEDALTSYKSAANLLSNTFGAGAEEGDNIKELKVSLNSNMAAVCLKTKDAKDAADYAQKVLEIEPEHTKALYRLSQAYVALAKYEEAVELLEKNRALLTDVNIDSEILRARKLKAMGIAKEKQIYSKMFA